MFCQKCGSNMGSDSVCQSCGYRYSEERIERRAEPEPERPAFLRQDSPAMEFLKDTGKFALKVAMYTFLGIVIFIVVVIWAVLK